MEGEAPLRWVPIEDAADERGDGGDRGDNGAGTRRPGVWWVIAAVAVVAAIAVTVGGRSLREQATSRSEDGGADELRTQGSLSTTPPPVRRASLTLDAPAELADGSTVEVTGAGFAEGAEVELRQCAAELCTQLEPFTTIGEPGTYRSSFVVGSLGTVYARVAVHRYLLGPGTTSPVDCLAGVDDMDPPCRLVAVIYSVNRSQYPETVALRFNDSNGPVAAANATSGLDDGQRIRLAGFGFAAGSVVQPALCPVFIEDAGIVTGIDRCEVLPTEVDLGPVDRSGLVMFEVSVPDRVGALDCGEPLTCGLIISPAQPSGQGAGGPLPISFAAR